MVARSPVVVVDTNVFGADLLRRGAPLATPYRQFLEGCFFVLSFQTVAELRFVPVARVGEKSARPPRRVPESSRGRMSRSRTARQVCRLRSPAGVVFKPLASATTTGVGTIFRHAQSGPQSVSGSRPPRRRNHLDVESGRCVVDQGLGDRPVAVADERVWLIAGLAEQGEAVQPAPQRRARRNTSCQRPTTARSVASAARNGEPTRREARPCWSTRDLGITRRRPNYSTYAPSGCPAR